MSPFSASRMGVKQARGSQEFPQVPCQAGGGVGWGAGEGQASRTVLWLRSIKSNPSTQPSGGRLRPGHFSTLWLQRHDRHRCLRGPVGGSRGWGVQMMAAAGNLAPRVARRLSSHQPGGLRPEALLPGGPCAGDAGLNGIPLPLCYPRQARVPPSGTCELDLTRKQGIHGRH